MEHQEKIRQPLKKVYGHGFTGEEKKGADLDGAGSTTTEKI